MKTEASEKKEEMVQEKVEKTEEKPERILKTEDTQPIITEDKEKDTKSTVPTLSSEESFISKAGYLSELLEIDYTRCFKYVQKFPELDNSQLLEKYFENSRLIWAPMNDQSI